MVTTVEANVVLIFATFTSCFTFVTTLDTCRQKRRSRGKSLSYRSFTESQRDVWTPTSSLDSSLLVMATSFPATSAAFSAQKYTKDLTQRKRLIRYSIFAHLMQCVSLSCLCSSLYVSRSRSFWIIPLILYWFWFWFSLCIWLAAGWAYQQTPRWCRCPCSYWGLQATNRTRSSVCWSHWETKRERQQAGRQKEQKKRKRRHNSCKYEVCRLVFK